MRILNVGGVPVRIFMLEGRECIQFLSGATIDGDGDPTNLFNDPHWQRTTSLTVRGRPVDSLTVPFIVLPPVVIRAVKGIVLGCFAEVLRLSTYASARYSSGEPVQPRDPDVVSGIYAVVADVGPKNRIGEISVAAAQGLGIPHSALNGGLSQPHLLTTVFPGLPARIRVGGEIQVYSLQRFRK